MQKQHQQVVLRAISSAHGDGECAGRVCVRQGESQKAFLTCLRIFYEQLLCISTTLCSLSLWEIDIAEYTQLIALINLEILKKLPNVGGGAVAPTGPPVSADDSHH
jgi:hypothetical protein